MSVESFQTPLLCFYQIKYFFPLHFWACFALYSQAFFPPLHFLVFISFKNHRKIYFRPACVALFNFNWTPPDLSLCLWAMLHLLPFKPDLDFPDFCLLPELFLAKIGMLILDFPCGSLNPLCSPFCLPSCSQDLSVCINHPNSYILWNHWIIFKSLVCFSWKASFRKWDSSPQKSKLWVLLF